MIQQTDAWLKSQESGMEALLRETVEINSHSQHPRGILRVAEAFRLAYGSFLKCDLRKSERFGAHLVFSTPASGKPITLVGHLDTVFPEGTFEGYSRDGDTARGPGVLDMKGGIVVAGFALQALHIAGVLNQIPVRMVLVGDEEVGSPEGAEIIKEVASNSVCGLVFESGRKGDLIITQRKRTGGLKVVARGKAAHAGNAHQDGINAIWALAHFVDQAQRLTEYGKGITLNVGKFTGGIGKNTVPELAEIEVDLRYVTSSDGHQLLQRLQQLALESEKTVPGVRVEIRGGLLRPPLEKNTLSAALCLEYATHAKAVGLGFQEAGLIGGGSDANTLSALGVPCIDGLGPRGTGFHTHEEQIEFSSLVPKAQAVTRFLLGRISPNA